VDVGETGEAAGEEFVRVGEKAGESGKVERVFPQAAKRIKTNQMTGKGLFPRITNMLDKPIEV
jgi:hypothetical protein